MIRKSALILIVGIVFLGGCLENQSSSKSANTLAIDTPNGMIDYLHRQNLPALQSVELWQNEYGPGLKLTTAHYEIFTTLL